MGTYNPFDPATPVISASRLDVVNEARFNLAALTHMVLAGGVGYQNWALSWSGGTAQKPTSLILTNGTTSSKIKWTITWGGGTAPTSNFISAITCDYSADGATYDTPSVGAFTFTYTGNDLTGGNVGSLALAGLVVSIGRVLQVMADLTTHAALTGASAHGLGTLSLQNVGAIAVTGGTINNVSVGVTTPAEGRFNRVTLERNSTYSPGAGAAVVLDFAKDYSEIVNNGSNSVTFTNVPATGRVCTHLLEVSNLNNTVGNLSSTTLGPGSGNPWGAGGKPSKAGRCLVAITTDDGGTSYVYTLVWSAV